MPNTELGRNGNGDLEIKIVITKEAVDTLLSFLGNYLQENSSKEANIEAVNKLDNRHDSQAINNINNNINLPVDKTASSTSPTITSKSPTLEEVEDYGRERKSCVNCTKFFNYYNAKGWADKAGKPLEDWKAVFQSWERTEFNQTYKQPIKPKQREFTPTEF